MSLPTRNVRLQLAHGSLFWREVGMGLPLVFLHGTWQDGEQWMPLLQYLGSSASSGERIPRRNNRTEGYHCFAPDLLGFGESSRPKLPYSIDLEVEVLAEWLDSLRCPPVVLVAEGLGGWIAASYALRFPERVCGLVLIAPEGVQTKTRRWGLERSLAGRFPWRAWGLQCIAPVARLLGWPWVAHQLAWRRELRRSPAACDILFRRRSRLIAAEQLDEKVGWLKVPVLLLQGEEANSTTVALTHTYAAAPLCELRILPGGDDLVHTEAEAIAAEIRTWLQTLNSKTK
ncbi:MULTISPECIES: alpha/beta hydrolase [unclassified Leptolyngbya]|uniref:alpha/beta fold hydrolase n=1 Tax=unclassified Leptolyngbya TaxID=2650499 RepID=UPI001689BF89|nr:MULTISPECIES: alpha/beta hydrolase [unclassified Leptolyngbya]MBD1912231.1 alpha/beta hydrolase [Leptolyngbya sp. FACHB-8]MBD2155122.1 alpha/beta hydrolase [Leptolyngbya sp. FACHB-16]